MDIIEFAEKSLGKPLYEYQKYLIRAMLEGKQIRTPRQVGRTYCANIIKEYIDFMDRTNGNDDGYLFPHFKMTEEGLRIADIFTHKKLDTE